ncbi:MAG TPA: diguanylate cyclase, partial [Candidatus Nitrosotenuis sp.]|nr:diguanylate cyclase [Candidatus Nitrosotenuis sp.]
KAVEESQARLQAIFDHVAEAIVIMDDAYVIQTVNPKALTIFGYQNGEMIDKTIYDLIPSTLNVDQTVDFDAYLRGNGLNEALWIEMWGQHKRGTKISLEISVKPVVINSKRMFIAIMRDISIRKQAEENLKQAKDQLERSLIQLEKINANNMILHETSSILQACISLEETYVPIQKFFEHLFPEVRGILYLMKPSRNYLESVMTWNNPKYRTLIFQPHECWALRRSQNHFVEQYHNPILCQHLNTKKLTIPAYLCVPIMAQSEIIGLFYLESHTIPVAEQTFTQEQRLVAGTFAEQVGLALSNLRLKDTLKQQSTRDSLTGLFNRRYLSEFLEQEIARAIRSHYSVAFIMLDVDNFKKFNDLYGHEAGDLVLKELGKVIQYYVRAGDITARYGGEEFIIILHNISKNAAKQRAETIRKAVESLDLHYGNKPLQKVTISLGLAMFPEHGQDSQTLLEAADNALYLAKHQGRNQVFIFKDDKELGKGKF